MSKTYSEKLLDPRWQRKRLEILSRSDFQCESCLNSEDTLHVHHKNYIKGREPWEYESHELVSLCKGCHEHEHESRELINSAISIPHRGAMDWGGLVGIVAGYLSAQCPDCFGDDIERLKAIGTATYGNDEAFKAGVIAHKALIKKRTARLEKGWAKSRESRRVE